MKSSPPLLITSAITPASSEIVELTSVEDRLNYTAEGINNWLRMLPELQIVICDGSNYDLQEFVNTQWPHASIEVLTFSNNSMKVSELGKGYGEGEISAYALKNSKILRRSKVFMKCTSKLWVNNIVEILQNNVSTQFHIKRRKNSQGLFVLTWVDTRFYIVEKRFYRRHLSRLYKTVNRKSKYYIEHAFLDRLTTLKSLPKIQFPIKPVICGVSGTSGRRHEK